MRIIHSKAVEVERGVAQRTYTGCIQASAWMPSNAVPAAVDVENWISGMTLLQRELAVDNAERKHKINQPHADRQAV